jgi:1-acyl-sn-glycerol-3-phosphate acyltransferase
MNSFWRLAPEGTRKKTQKLRTGFYFIAKGANVPIIPCGFDFARKAIVVGEPFYTTENQEGRFRNIVTHFTEKFMLRILSWVLIDASFQN